MTNRKTDNTCHCNDRYYDKETTGVYNCTECKKKFAICSAENTGT